MSLSGSLDLTGGFQNYSQVAVSIDLGGPRVEYLNVADPRKVLHAGYVALALPVPPANVHSEVGWWSYIDFEYERWHLSPLINASRIVWSLSLTTRVTIQITY